LAAACGEKKNGGSLIFAGRSLGKLERKKIQTSDRPRNFEVCEHLEAHMGSSFGEVASAAILQNSQRAK
jgi:hypothetical protein